MFGKDTKHGITSVGGMYIIYHNTYVICVALQEAGERIANHRRSVPEQFQKLVSVLDHVFSSQTPHDVIAGHIGFLNNIMADNPPPRYRIDEMAEFVLPIDEAKLHAKWMELLGEDDDLIAEAMAKIPHLV